jgi:hypothetical protein
MPVPTPTTHSRRAAARAARTTDLWLCRCLTCGTSNPVSPAFRESRGHDVITISAAGTKLPETCTGCGQPLRVFNPDAVPDLVRGKLESIGETRERKARLKAERKSFRLADVQARLKRLRGAP